MLISLVNSLKKYLFFTAVLIAITTILWVNSAFAIEIDAALRTVPLNASDEQITLETKQIAEGQRLFNESCVQCHLDGGTKTNPDVDLGPLALSLATPPRNNVESIVDYLKSPTTYDGSESLAELHPSTSRSDLFPQMRNLTDSDLGVIAGYILTQPGISGEQWGGGKPKR